MRIPHTTSLQGELIQKLHGELALGYLEDSGGILSSPVNTDYGLFEGLITLLCPPLGETLFSPFFYFHCKLPSLWALANVSFLFTLLSLPGPAHDCEIYIALQGLILRKKGPVLVLMVCCHRLEILNNFWPRGPTFCTGSANHVIVLPLAVDIEIGRRVTPHKLRVGGVLWSPFRTQQSFSHRDKS